MSNQNLFNALYDICGFIALQTDMREIIDAVEKDKADGDGEEDDVVNGVDFQCCDDCDLPDACEDFGCAIKAGIKKVY